ncbi:hypothetical protein EUGRSUZ_F02668 [Eucalyptus grandis]|uniref:Uncharacterized protein n=2 Tax=Eucalyptus grandis TaxID=71139 RepID=A0ACC3KJF2_EUCGR|nr:hypothetical protein EUGRSUZ_F02668 [Eucalyptus grandis]
MEMRYNGMTLLVSFSASIFCLHHLPSQPTMTVYNPVIKERRTLSFLTCVTTKKFHLPTRSCKVIIYLSKPPLMSFPHLNLEEKEENICFSISKISIAETPSNSHLITTSILQKTIQTQ